MCSDSPSHYRAVGGTGFGCSRLLLPIFVGYLFTVDLLLGLFFCLLGVFFRFIRLWLFDIGRYRLRRFAIGGGLRLLLVLFGRLGNGFVCCGVWALLCRCVLGPAFLGVLLLGLLYSLVGGCCGGVFFNFVLSCFGLE